MSFLETRLRALACLAALLASGVDAWALSCARMEERYYFDCADGGCAPVFRTTPAPVDAGPCTRKDVVAEIPPEIATYLGRLILASAPAPLEGRHSIRLTYSWWEYRPPDTFAQFQDRFLREYVNDRDGRSLDLISIDEVAEKLDRYTGRKWIQREDPIPALELRKHIEAEAEDVESWGRRIRGECWAGSALLAGLLALSAGVVFAGMRRPIPARRRFALIGGGVAIQAALIAGVIAGSMPLALISCVAPFLLGLAALIIIVAETGFGLWRLARAKRPR
jgi:hypothetical protein